MLRLILLGGLRLEDSGEPVTGRASQKRRLALLALLSLPPGRLLTRDKLAGFLWPERDDERARHLLSAALYDLRRELGEETVRTPGDDIGLDPDRITSDAAEFTAALEAGDLERATGLYGGPFLDGVYLGAGSAFDEWVETQRQRLAWRNREALEELARRHESAGDTRAAVDAWRRLANQDPHTTRIAVGYMRALDAAGDRARALQFFGVHSALLREDLDTDPDPEVVALAERLRVEPAVTDPGEPAPDPTAPTTSTPAAAGGPTIAPEVAPEAAPDVNPPGPGAPALGDRLWPLLAVVASILAVIVVVVMVLGPGEEGPGSDRIGVAVLPFENVGSAPGEEHWAVGLTDEILTALARIERFRVPGRTSVFAVANGTVDARDAARQLQVDYVVEGSVRSGEDQLRISAMLVDTRRGSEVLWSQQYDRGKRNVLQVQEEIARSIVGALRPHLAGDTAPIGDGQAPLVRTTTDDPVAYESYLRAREHWYARTPQDLGEALEHLGRAVERDPRYARAYAGIADVYNTLGAFDYGIRPPPEVYPRARQAAERALALAPDLPEAHAALGATLFNYDWDWDRAEQHFQEAIRLNPGDVMARHWYSLLLRASGRPGAAMHQIQAAREQDPRSPIISTSLARHHHFARDYDAARAEVQRALELDSTHVQAHLALGLTAVQQGRYAEALGEYRTARRLLGVDAPIVVGLTAHALGLTGDTAAARQLYDGLRAASGRAYVAPQYLALAALGLGDHDAAIRWLDEALDERSATLIYLRLEPIIDPLRPEPGFQRLVRRAEAAGLPAPAR